MSRRAEFAYKQEQQENLSGSDIFDAQQWEETMKEVPLWAKENRRILDEFEMLTNAIRGNEEKQNVGL